MKFFSLVTVLVLIAGCAFSPPPGYHTKKGTLRPYKIDGRWYIPLESSSGFEQMGVASWYGSDFHGKKTASGEFYNMHAKSAAHKILPMETYVRVTRVDNGLETVVRINDRGPFIKGRIIDLSYSAARDIGILDEGVARVKISALDNAPAAAFIKNSYSERIFAVQVGAFRLYPNAVKLLETLKAKYKKVYITRISKNSSQFFRVRIEKVKSRKEAEGFGRVLV